MVKRIILVLIVTLVSSHLFSAELEDIWALCRENNVSIKEAGKDVEIAKYNLKTDIDNNGNTYLGFDSTINYPRDYEKGSTLKPLSYEESLSYRHNLNSSTVLGISLRNTLTNEYIYYAENRFAQSTSLSFSLSQSLLPYWLRGETDPYISKLEEAVRLKESDKAITEKEVIQNVTSCYIRIRYYLRMAEFYTKAIEEYRNIIKVLEALGDNVSIETKQSISEYRDSLWNYTLNISNIYESLEEQKRILSNLCGTKIEVNSIKELPNTRAKIFDFNPSEEKINHQILALEYERSLNKQNTSPVISLSAGFINKSEVVTYKDFWDGLSVGKNWNYYINISFDLSSLISSDFKVSDNEYKVSLEKLELEREYINIQRENEIDQHRNLLKKTEERLYLAKDMLTFYEDKINQAERLYKRGEISEITLKSYMLSYAQMKVAYESVQDEIWLYNWIIQNI